MSRPSSKPTKPSDSSPAEPDLRLDRPICGAARAWGCLQLRKAKVQSYILDADLLLAGVLQVGRIDLHINRDVSLSEEQTQRYVEFIERRSAHEPVDYVLGRRDFMGLDFIVDRRALVPRPSTELLVEKTLEFVGLDVGLGRVLRPEPKYDPLIVDVGTGCGVAAVALAHYLPSASVVASDVSVEALTLARENVELNDCRTRVFPVAADLQPATIAAPDFLVANLPYIPTGDIGEMQPDVRDFEPRLALDGGTDGFSLYRRLIYAARIRPGGALLLEIGYEHGDRVRSAAALRSSDLRVEVFPDLVGLDRIAIITGWA